MFYPLSLQKEKSEYGGDGAFPPPQATCQPVTAGARGHAPFPIPTFRGKCPFLPHPDTALPTLAACAGQIHAALLPGPQARTQRRCHHLTTRRRTLFFFFPFPPSNQVLAKHRAAREPNMENSPPGHASPHHPTRLIPNIKPEIRI